MTYGTVSLRLSKGSLSFVKKNNSIVRHYVGTGLSDSFDVGKGATEISCTLIALDETEKITLLALLHAQVERNLIFDVHYYKRVISGNDISVKLDLGTYYISVTFIALDPLPYSVSTDEVMY